VIVLAWYPPIEGSWLKGKAEQQLAEIERMETIKREKAARPPEILFKDEIEHLSLLNKIENRNRGV